MKLKYALSSLLIVGSCLGFAAPGFAAVCNGTQGSAAASAAGASFTGNSCGNNANYNGSTFCGGVSFSTTGTDVWQVQISGTTDSFTFGVSSDAFQPDIALFATSCADNATCVNGTDYEAATAPPASTVTSAAVTNQTAGSYFVVITDSTGAGAQCGAYNLTLTGTSPVKLQDFSVQ